MARVDHKGRNKYERHTRLPHHMTGSAAWRDLSGNATKVLIALQRLDPGDANGALFFSIRKAAEETGLSRNTVVAALRDLESHGFVVAVKRGEFHRIKRSPATTWRLTFATAPALSMPTTNEWQRWKPEVETKSRAQKLNTTGSKAAHNVETAPATGSNIAPDTMETPLVSVVGDGSNIGTQVICHRQRDSGARFSSGNSLGKIGGPETLVGDVLVTLRNRLVEYLNSGTVGEQSRLAELANIPGGTLSKFISGRGLNRAHFVALQLELQKRASA